MFRVGENGFVSKAIQPVFTRSSPELSSLKTSAGEGGNHNWLWAIINRNNFLMAAWLPCNFDWHKDLEGDCLVFVYDSSLPLSIPF